jgi:hypothetical protein
MSAADLSTTPAEPLGASTAAVLRDTLGLDDLTIARLHADGVVASPE